MTSKFDRLRAGEAVQFKPGQFGRLNNETKSLELSDGLNVYVGDDPDFYPKDENALAYSREKERVNREINRHSMGEFFHQFSNQGLLGSAKDIVNRISKSGDDYLRSKQVNAQLSNEISERSPWTSGAATVASFIPDIALTRGMSALKAAPTLTALHSGTRILDEPGQVAGEVLASAAGGFLVDKGGSFLSRMSKRRGEFRELPAKQAAVEEANRLQNEEFNLLKQNTRATNESRLQQHQADLNARQNTIIQEKNAFQQAKAAQEEEFNFLTQNTKTTNEARIQKYEADLRERQNNIVKEENAYKQRKLERDEEVLRLKNKAKEEKAQRSANAARADAEYESAKKIAESENKRMDEKFRLDKEQYDKDLKSLPEMQRKAQKEYSEGVLKNVETISNAFPKNSRIYSSQFGTNEFIDEYIQKSNLAGTREANQSSKILKSIFPEGEILTRNDLINRYKALEGAIQKANPEVREALNNFKTHLGERIPVILENNMAYDRVFFTLKRKGKNFEPFFKNQVEKEVFSILDQMQLSETGSVSRSFLKLRAKENINQIFRDITPENFILKMRNGEIRDKILKNILKESDFSGYFSTDVSSWMKKNTTGKKSIDYSHIQSMLINPSKLKLDEFTNAFINKLDAELAKAKSKIIAVEIDASKRLGSKLKKTYGTASPLPPPKAPLPPEYVSYPPKPGELPPISPIDLPPPIEPPITPTYPEKPELLSMPTKSTIPPPQIPHMPSKPDLLSAPMAPTEIPSPTLSPAQGLAERAGDFLEKPLLSGGKGALNNPFVKLGGLKYLLGKAALPAEAAYLGLKGLTSPTAAGEMARISFKQAGIQAIVMLAQKYPSYHNGILENPQERRSLTKEIEDDPEIPIEQKAILQSKVNRGRPLQEKL